MLHVFSVCGSEGSTSPMYLRLQCFIVFVNAVVIEHAWLFNSFAVGGFLSRVYFCMLCLCGNFF
jgi:hypothetical protein